MGPNFQVGFLKLKEAQSSIQHFFSWQMFTSWQPQKMGCDSYKAYFWEKIPQSCHNLREF
jgi:hypothetical protein